MSDDDLTLEILSMKSNLALALAIAVSLCACSPSAEEKIKAQVQDKVHALTADERLLAETNAKQYFNKEFPTLDQAGKNSTDRGVYLECRPSDSNFNGMVTCKGIVPQLAGGRKEITRYCGYTPGLVGCSDEDTVK